jgi:hypothetical protein
MTNKTKLSGGPEKTITWIYLEDGQLKVEYYDFSPDAQDMFGNDIAYTLSVRDMNRVHAVTKQNESSLIEWMKLTFQSYFEIKRWLEENEIGFDTEIEGWA